MPVQTVLGPIDPASLGVTLMHEHVLVDFAGALTAHPSRYVRADVVTLVRPHLERLRARGCRTLVECTPAYLGRDAELLAMLARASGLQILTNTGYYGAVQDRYLPPHAFSESAAGLARRWIDEWARGIEGTGIRPAFMKISVDAGPLSPVDARLVEAAAITHRETGLRIHSHTPDAPAGFAQLDRLAAEGVQADAFVWVHAQNVRDVGVLAEAAARGAWIELDGVSPAALDLHVELVSGLASRGHFDRVLVSHDAGWYRVGEPGGGGAQFRGYELVWTDFIPALRSRGITDAQIAALLVEHPRRVLTPAER
jgi:phosphotriesterase-related protein